MASDKITIKLSESKTTDRVRGKATSKSPTTKKSPKKKVAKKATPKRAARSVASDKPKSSTRPTGLSDSLSSLPVPGTPMTQALGETFLTDLISDWYDNGSGVIEICRTTKPDAYLKLIATYAPKEFRKTLEPFAGMSDNHLKERLKDALEKIRTLGLD
jgi:hypothetical protein